ncbi:HEL230Wp [Eremothecium sinecaudum]|uniref:HEL230Wp n=1 Tax=Eremothecium sinecaudum TaxID=45286 RepID=A0A0X8HT94_9SACH|nr:HEL230Wp [Eremothecium sinecaudum]AMD21051.1 HEL230Wp [Eremothecium sinecaudum]
MIRSIRGFSTSNLLRKADIKASIESTASPSIKKLKAIPTAFDRIKSASNLKGYRNAKLPPGTYFIPAPSSATGSINSETIPKSFLPKNDPRRELVDTLREGEAALARSAPPLSNKGEKTYHLTPAEVEKIKELRNSNPEKYTRKVLAKMYNVSPLFISMVSNAPAARLEEMQRRLAVIQASWHPGRAQAREDRKKRQQLWYRA